MVSQRKLSVLASVGIFCLILFIGTKYYSRILTLIKDINVKWFFVGIICYYCNYLCRAYRIWCYAGRLGHFFPTFVKISGLHGFNSYFLPLRSGDLTLPLLLHLHADIPLVQGGRILIRARLLDLFLLGFLLIIATLFTPTMITMAWQIIFLAIGFCFISFPYAATYFLRSTSHKSNKWFQRIIGEEQPDYPKLDESVLSLLIWFWTGSTIFCVIRSLDIPLAFLDVWFLATIQLPLQLLPVQGVANSGNHEVGWVVGLGLLGMSPEKGLTLALSSHILIICFVGLLGLASVLMPSGNSTK